MKTMNTKKDDKSFRGNTITSNTGTGQKDFGSEASGYHSLKNAIDVKIEPAEKNHQESHKETKEEKKTDWFNAAQNIYFDLYENQMKNNYDFFNTLFNSFLSAKEIKMNPGSRFQDMFSNSFPFQNAAPFLSNNFMMNGEYYDELKKSAAIIAKQNLKFNLEMFDMFNKELQLTEEKWSTANGKIQKTIKDHVNASRDLIKSNLEDFQRSH